MAADAGSWGAELGGPTVLIVGSGEPDPAALRDTLSAHGATVVLAASAEAAHAASLHAPDLVVLLGDAAEARGEAALAVLAAQVATSVVPVVVVGQSDADALGDYGVVGWVSRTSALEQMAERIVGFATAIPERRGTKLRALGESVEQALALAFARDRTGILAVRGADRPCTAILTNEQPAARTLEELLERIEPVVARDEELAITFRELAPGRMTGLPPSALDASLADLRVVVLEPSRAALGEIVEVVRRAGARALAIDAGGAGVGRARALAPDVIVLDEAALADWSAPAMTAILRDVRLSWASVLVTSEDELRLSGSDAFDAARLTAGVRRLVSADDQLTESARNGEGFAARLEATGPVRLLRALLRASRHVYVEVAHPSAYVEIELARELVVGARATGPGGERAVGHAALATLLALSSGRVRVAARDAPSLPNLMAPLDDALAVAMHERPLPRSSSRAATELEAAHAAAAIRVSGRALHDMLASRLTALHASTTVRSPRVDVPAEPSRTTQPPPIGAGALTTHEPEERAEVVTDRPAAPEPSVPAAELSAASSAPVPTAIGHASPKSARAPGRTGAFGLAALATLSLALAYFLAGGHAPQVAAPVRAVSPPVPVAEPPEPRAPPDTPSAPVARPPVATDSPSVPTPPAAVLDDAAITAMIHLGNAARRRGDLDGAQRYYEDVAAHDPTNTRALAGLARVHRARGELDDAVRYATMLVERRADHPANFVLLGDLLVLTGDREGGRAVYQTAADRFPNNVTARERLSQLDR